MSWLTKISLCKRWLTFLIVGLITIGSILAILNLKMELIPDIKIPVISVITQYPQASPQEVMEDVTIPIEDAIKGIGNLEQIESTSSKNSSFVIAIFEYGTDMEATQRDISQRLQNAIEQDKLPDKLSEMPPYIFPLSMEMMPLVMLSVTGENMSTVELRKIAEEDIVPAILDVDGLLAVTEEEESPLVKAVDIMGGEERASIYLDAEKMNQLGIPMSWVVATLDPALEGKSQYNSLDEIGDTNILNNPISPKLKDVADVEPPIYTTRTNGKPSISIIVRKDPEANTVDVANAVMDKVEEVGADIPSIEILTIMDQSEFIEGSIRDLTREAIIGGILAIIVIFLFLWAGRASLVTIISIPLSLLIGFLIMYASGITINLITLSAMAIVVGRVVDDSIVVLENIYRHMRQGEGFGAAALSGAREVAVPITSATIATVAIFIPLIFIGGIVGELFRPFALTLTFALLASLVVALMVVPPLSSIISTRRVSFEGGESWYRRIYARMLRWSLGHRAITLVIAAVLVLGSFGLIPVIGTSFLPSMGEQMITVEIEMPKATDVELAQKVEQVEEAVKGLKMGDCYTTIGNPMGISMGPMGGMGGTNTATLMIALPPESDLEGEAADLRQACQPLSGDDTTIHVLTGEAAASMMGGGDTLMLRVTGDDLDKVTLATEALAEELKGMEGLTDLESELALGRDKPAIVLDSQKAMAAGLDLEKAGMELALIEYGYPFLMPGRPTAETPEVEIDGTNFGILVPGIVESVKESGQIENLWVSTGGQSKVRLGEIAEINWQSASYSRAEWKYAGSVSATITEKDVGAVNRAVQEKFQPIEQGYGVSIKAGGVAEMMQDTFRNMGIAILIAIVIAYLVIVVSLRSWLNPLIIMVSLPLASIGALLGLLITGQTLGASALMGALMLVGIVLTNAIVLLTFVEQLRKGGMSTHDALMTGGSIRLRPILMTALTTMLALVPLALGLEAGVLMAAELATVVIGGLFASTLLTLLVIPVLYSLVEGLRHRPTP